ncbi:hypothetical protein T02_3468 [Trichinella nativa]|uniref:Uncharacterized protein n=1 Tax=Trichinella nativa TaxID=6335 RepID=A0A0V1KP22_9BILA|nr:hypothetical protein T02_3468 [Trichinella nativa]
MTRLWLHHLLCMKAVLKFAVLSISIFVRFYGCVEKKVWGRRVYFMFCFIQVSCTRPMCSCIRLIITVKFLKNSCLLVI